MSPGPVHVVAMGVSATGKTTVAERMAADLGYEFIEGDEYHPQSNLNKMSAGIPLRDEDRMPWLTMLADLIGTRDAEGISTILTCSALRRSYRDILRGPASGETFFVHLHAPFEVLKARMSHRSKHFMPTSLLQSQFETLEPLGPDELGVVLDVSQSLDDVVAQAEGAVLAFRDESRTC